MTTKTVDTTLTTDTPPSHYIVAYEQNLYHKEEYLKCRPGLPRRSFWLCDHQKAQIHGVIHFHLNDERAVSQAYAPFGAYNGGVLTDRSIRNCISAISAWSVEHGLNELEFKLPSPCYDSGGGWASALEALGFTGRHSINHHLVVDNRHFEDKIHTMEKRKLARCKQFRFAQQPADSLHSVYHFIEACRQQRDQNLSMTYEAMENAVKCFPGNYLLFTASFQNELAAAAIVVQVNSRCWYLFYPAHSKRFDRESPLVFLLSEMYLKARDEGIQIFDLGTSEVHGRPMEGLLKFKERVGGIATMRSNYLKFYDQSQTQQVN